MLPAAARREKENALQIAVRMPQLGGATRPVVWASALLGRLLPPHARGQRRRPEQAAAKGGLARGRRLTRRVPYISRLLLRRVRARRGAAITAATRRRKPRGDPHFSTQHVAGVPVLVQEFHGRGPLAAPDSMSRGAARSPSRRHVPRSLRPLRWLGVHTKETKKGAAGGHLGSGLRSSAGAGWQRAANGFGRSGQVGGGGGGGGGGMCCCRSPAIKICRRWVWCGQGRLAIGGI